MTTPHRIIGLTGPKGSGKDTVAALLRTHAGFYPLAFADALREEVCDAWRFEPVYLTRPETKEHPLSALALRRCLNDGFVARMMLDHTARGATLDLDAPRSPRQILQWWGTEYRRNQDPDYWISMLQLRVDRLLTLGHQTRLVVTDCRFANEIDTVRGSPFGGRIWQITRPGCGVPMGSHVSEVTGTEFAPDAVINNAGDILHLRQQVLNQWWALDAGLAKVTAEIES